MYLDRVALIGEMQNIIYDGWLPIVMGKEGMSAHNLNLDETVQYSPKVNPSIINAFSTAAFRLANIIVFSKAYETYKLLLHTQWKPPMVSMLILLPNWTCL